MTFKRYWYHPESDSVWSSTKDEILDSDGLVEEIDFAQYLQLMKGRNMVGMNYSFDARQFDPVQSIGSHPVGKFPATISHTENVETKDKTGGMFVVTFTTPAGQILFRYNLWNKEPKAVEIAHKQLSALCYATGIFQLGFQDEGAALRNARLMIEVGYQKGEDPAQNPEAKGYTEVKKIFDVNGNEPGKAPAPAAQPQQGNGWAQQGNANVTTGLAVPQQQAPQGWQQGPQPPAQSQPPAQAAPAPQQAGWQPGPTQSGNTAPPWANK